MFLCEHVVKEEEHASSIESLEESSITIGYVITKNKHRQHIQKRAHTYVVEQLQAKVLLL